MFVAAALVVSAAAAAPTPYHVYAVSAPPQRGIYRLRLSEDAANAWDIEQLPSVSIYDNTGQNLSCELLPASRLGTTKKTYPLSGAFHDVGKPANNQNAYDRFASAWQFAMPALADNESPTAVAFDWRSDALQPGRVKLVEVPEKGYNPYGGPMVADLSPSAADPHGGHVIVSLYGQSMRTWSSTAELRFTLPKEEFTIESPTMDTATKKPWTLERAGGPGWILFNASGNGPYRTQLGAALYGCSTMGLPATLPDSYFDADFPPEATMGAELPNAPRMGESVSKFEDQRDKQALGLWLAWGIAALVGFISALAIALKPPR